MATDPGTPTPTIAPPHTLDPDDEGAVKTLIEAALKDADDALYNRVVLKLITPLEKKNRNKFLILAGTMIILALIAGGALFFHPLKGQMRTLDAQAVTAGFNDEYVGKHCAEVQNEKFPHLKCQTKMSKPVDHDALAVLDGLSINPLELSSNSGYGTFSNLQELFVQLAKDATTLDEMTLAIPTLLDGSCYKRSDDPVVNGCYTFKCEYGNTELKQLRRHNGDDWVLCE